MFDRPTRALWGIGSKTARKLAELGCTRFGDLAGADPAVVAERVRPDHRSVAGAAGPGHGRRTVDRHPVGGRARAAGRRPSSRT